MKRSCGSIAFDLKSSTRERLPNGFLLVRSNNLTREQVSPYLGKEVSAGDEVGWDDNKVYSLYRAGDELEKATPLYNGLPLLLGHHAFDPSNPPKDMIIGTIGSDAKFAGGYMTNSLTIWDTSAIDAIESGAITELSVGYSYDLEPSPGNFDGAAYDGVMRNIRPEHVALVEKGRAGAEVRVGDAALDADVPGHAFHGNQQTGGFGSFIKKRGAAGKKKAAGTVAVKDIAKRKEVSPKAGVAEYGKVRFADPKNKKYPIDTPKHVRAALSYWGMAKNRSKYSKADQAVIGKRIRAASKRLGIGSTTGDSAGKHKETTMASSAKKNLSPLAHKVAGAVTAHLRTKLAADAAIKGKDLLQIVKNVSESRFHKQIAGITGALKAKYGLDSTDELRNLLLALDEEEVEDEDDEDDEELEDEEEVEDEDDEFPDDLKKKTEEGEEGEDGCDAGDPEPDAEKAAEKKMAKKVLGKKEAEKAFSGDKKSMDATISAAVSKATSKAQDAYKQLRQAERDVQPLVGDVEGFDTAAEVYKYALDQAGVAVEGVHPSAFPAMVRMLGKPAPQRSAADESSASTLTRFPGLKGIKRLG